MNHKTTNIQTGFRPSWIYAMAVGSAVGWGAFVLPFEWLSSAGLLAVVTGFVIGTLLVGIIAINYGYATRSLPVTGGAIAFALASFGRWHGFIAGWSLLLGYGAIICLNASAVTLVLRLIIPEIMMTGALYDVSGWTIYAPEVAVSSLFLVAFAYLNARNTAMSGQVQFIAVVLMLAGVAAVLAGTGFAFVQVGADWSVLPLAPPSGVSFWAAVGALVAFAPWAYVGFDGVPQLAGEFRFRPAKVMILLIASVISAGVLYVALVLASAFAFGADLQSYAGSSWAVGLAVSSVMGKLGLGLMVLAVSVGVLTGLNGFYVATSRVVLTMSRAQMFPEKLGTLHPKYGTPTTALYVIMALCLISPWFGRASLLWIVEMASVGIAVTFFYTCACSYKLGHSGVVFGMNAQLPSQKQACFGALGMAISLGFLALLFLPSSAGALSTPAHYALAVWALAGLAFYTYRKHTLSRPSDDYLRHMLFAKMGS